MKRTTRQQFLLSAAILLYWIVYYIQDHLSNLGDYRFFPFELHEVYGIGGLVLPSVTVVWFLTLLIRSRRNGHLRKNALLLAVLLALTVGQFGAVAYEKQRFSTMTRAEVVEIPDDFHIVIQCEGKTVTLRTSPLVPPLLKTDGTLYWFDYGTNRLHPERGTLHRISQ